MLRQNSERMSDEGGLKISPEEKGKIDEKNRVFKLYLEAYRAPGRGFKGIDMLDYPEFREAEEAMNALIARGIATEADRKFMKKEAARRRSFGKERGEQK